MMKDVGVMQFIAALRNADDASAMALLERGRVTVHSVATAACLGESDNVRDATAPIIWFAVLFGREQVARALIHLGADIDVIWQSNTASFIRTPAGEAVCRGDASALALCHRLGANLSRIARPVARPESIMYSALSVALKMSKSDCFAYLLDNVCLARPIELSSIEVYNLCLSATSATGDPKAFLQVLEVRGYNFKLLKETPASDDPDGENCADVLLSAVRHSRDADLLRYAVKVLGVASTMERLHKIKNWIDGILPVSLGEAELALTKYTCVSCDAVGPTKVCTGCRAVRYCSKECSRVHWKTGGHKKECKYSELKLKRSATQTSSSAAGPSQP